MSIHLALARKELLATHELSLEIASRNFCAHSSQQTSTTRAPILTLMPFPSSLQSHAAQVFFNHDSSPFAAHVSWQAQQIIPCLWSLSKSLAIF